MIMDVIANVTVSWRVRKNGLRGEICLSRRLRQRPSFKTGFQGLKSCPPRSRPIFPAPEAPAIANVVPF
ncbi:hypothetical protein VC81_00975 [Levilactobacillus spicheri]|uniref:Uncharacterized protein n=1 Tax=Levilactobacillus spicheri TaxID=216463 RepID=A0A0F3RYC1_9LACO|nr:hypothetical protein VC81_00975 [Levilactobacillus spicheri]